LKSVAAIGLSHKTARVEVRERFALDTAARRALVSRLLAMPGVAESVVLSTCNRTEVYVVGRAGGDESLPVEPIRDALIAIGNGAGARASDFSVLEGEAAVRHAFAVAAGLDSLVLGETQILGQVRGAFQEAVDCGAVGASFQRLFPAVFKAAKRAHTETAISEGQASVGSIAVELAAKVFADLESRTVLLIGAGDSGETIAVSLHERRVGRLLIAGRGVERSSRLAERVSGVALPLDAALGRLADADIVLTAATNSDGDYLLPRASLQRALEARKGAPLLVVDVAVPRNVDPVARDLSDLFLYDLDDLEAVAADTRRRRQKEVRKVESLLEEGVRAFAEWWGVSATIAPLVRELHAQADATRRRELERTLAQLPSEHHAAVERFSRSLTDKLLQGPTIELRRGGTGLRERLDLVRRLFGLGRSDTEDES
jgi:glutamyl-tRNA reductase